MTPPSSARAELANALRQLNLAFAELPHGAQERVQFGIDDIEREVDRAVLAGDRDAALEAIDRWRDRWLERFRSARRAT